MKRIVRSLSLLGACLAAGSAATQAPRLPELAVPVIAAPRLDGVLDDAGWRQAAVISNFTLVGAPGSRAVSGPHEVYVGRDAEWLYVGFRVEQAAADRNPGMPNHEARFSA